MLVDTGDDAGGVQPADEYDRLLQRALHPVRLRDALRGCLPSGTPAQHIFDLPSPLGWAINI